MKFISFLPVAQSSCKQTSRRGPLSNDAFSSYDLSRVASTCQQPADEDEEQSFRNGMRRTLLQPRKAAQSHNCSHLAVDDKKCMHQTCSRLESCRLDVEEYGLFLARQIGKDHYKARTSQRLTYSNARQHCGSSLRFAYHLATRKYLEPDVDNCGDSNSRALAHISAAHSVVSEGLTPTESSGTESEAIQPLLRGGCLPNAGFFPTRGRPRDEDPVPPVLWYLAGGRPVHRDRVHSPCYHGQPKKRKGAREQRTPNDEPCERLTFGYLRRWKQASRPTDRRNSQTGESERVNRPFWHELAYTMSGGRVATMRLRSEQQQ